MKFSLEDIERGRNENGSPSGWKIVDVAKEVREELKRRKFPAEKN